MKNSTHCIKPRRDNKTTQHLTKLFFLQNSITIYKTLQTLHNFTKLYRTLQHFTTPYTSLRRVTTLHNSSHNFTKKKWTTLFVKLYKTFKTPQNSTQHYKCSHTYYKALHNFTTFTNTPHNFTQLDNNFFTKLYIIEINSTQIYKTKLTTM